MSREFWSLRCTIYEWRLNDLLSAYQLRVVYLRCRRPWWGDVWSTAEGWIFLFLRSLWSEKTLYCLRQVDLSPCLNDSLPSLPIPIPFDALQRPYQMCSWPDEGRPNFEHVQRAWWCRNVLCFTIAWALTMAFAGHWPLTRRPLTTRRQDFSISEIFCVPGH